MGARISGSLPAQLITKRILAKIILNSHQDRQVLNSTQCKEEYELLCLSRQVMKQDRKGSWLPQKHINDIQVLLLQFTVLPHSLFHVHHVAFPHPTLPLCVHPLTLKL